MITGISRFTKGEFSQEALDEVYNKGKELYKDPVAPPSSGIIVATEDSIWEDMHGTNTGWCSNMPDSYDQFQGPVRKNITGHGDWNNVNMWYEVEEAGDGFGCSLGISKSTNTRVEVGWKRGYALMDSKTGDWFKYIESKTEAGGSAHPHCGQNNFTWYRGSQRCDRIGDSRFFNIQIQHRACSGWPPEDQAYVDKADGSLDFELGRIEPSSGFLSLRPQYYFRQHGWPGGFTFSDPSKVKAIYAEMYARLILHDPNGVDDRHLSKFVVHISADIRNKTPGQDDVYIGDIGMTRYKTITNDWQHFGFLTSDLTQAEFEANPPPFATVP